MTWTNIKETGNGRLRFRVSIEGFPYEAVTHADMEGTAADGRIRYGGLSMKGVQITQRANPLDGTLEGGSITFKLGDDRTRSYWTEAFSKSPTASTWLNANIDDTSGGIMSVLSTGTFPSSGYLYLDQEVIAYEVDDIVGFVMNQRGVWGTLAAHHYIVNGDAPLRPEITNWPTIIEGRRVRLYVYGAGDDPQGEGTQIWLGILRGEPKMEGPLWSFMCDSVASVLDQEIGVDLGSPVRPRGITLFDFRLTVVYNPTGVEIPLAIGPSHETATIEWDNRFFESNADFAEALNTDLAALITTAGWDISSITCIGGNDSEPYHFQLVAGTAGNGFCLKSAHLNRCAEIEPAFQMFTEAGAVSSIYLDDAKAVQYSPASFTWPMVPLGTYYQFATDETGGKGTVPRGVYDETSQRTFYVDGISPISSLDSVSISWPDEEYAYSVFSTDAVTRSMDLVPTTGLPPDDRTAAGSRVWLPSSLPTIKFTVFYGDWRGTYGLMADLVSKAPELVNLGAVPMIRSGDWVNGVSTDWYDAYHPGEAYATNRLYVSSEAVSLKDLICPDLQLLAHFLSFDETGRLTIKPLAIPSSSATVQVYHIEGPNLLTKNGLPVFERAASGIYNTLLVRDGYDAAEDDYTLPSITVRNVTAYGRKPEARTIKIELKSKVGATPFTNADAVSLASHVLGTYGQPYAYVTCEVPLNAYDKTVIGGAVSITSGLLPGASGVRGVTDLMGLVIGREIDLYGGTIALTLLVALRGIAGYAFDAPVTSQTFHTGTSWFVEVDLSYFPTGSVFFPDGTTPGDYVSTGDRIQLYKFDTETPGTVYGYVQSGLNFWSTGSMLITLDSAWTPGSDEWVLSFDVSTKADATTNQRRFAYVADSSATIDWEPDPDATAYTFNPG